MGVPGENCDRHEAEIQRLRNHANDLFREMNERKIAMVKLEQQIQGLHESIPDNLGATLARMDEKMSGINTSVTDIVEALKRGYVTVSEFDPVKKIVYGLVGAVLLGVMGAILGLVLTK